MKESVRFVVSIDGLNVDAHNEVREMYLGDIEDAIRKLREEYGTWAEIAVIIAAIKREGSPL
jgi:hypothetical protein